jgi:hypothetical protein
MAARLPHWLRLPPPPKPESPPYPLRKRCWKGIFAPLNKAIEIGYSRFRLAEGSPRGYRSLT